MWGCGWTTLGSVGVPRGSPTSSFAIDQPSPAQLNHSTPSTHTHTHTRQQLAQSRLDDPGARVRLGQASDGCSTFQLDLPHIDTVLPASFPATGTSSRGLRTNMRMQGEITCWPLLLLLLVQTMVGPTSPRALLGAGRLLRLARLTTAPPAWPNACLYPILPRTGTTW